MLINGCIALFACGAAEAIVDGFPLGSSGRVFHGDPVEVGGVGLVKFFVEDGGVGGGFGRHVDDVDIRTAWCAVVLQVNSFALFGQAPIRD